MVNWILPTRGVQAILSITVLGLMAYGSFLCIPSFTSVCKV
jgi:hypothetical protein